MKVAFSQQRLASRVRQLGRQISRDYAGRTLDVVVVLENSFLFAADLVRKISRPIVCHFVRLTMRDIRLAGHDYREIFFTTPPALRGRHVLVVDAVLTTGVSQEFLLRRIEETRPRSLRLAVLFDRPASHKVDLEPAYAGFAAASKQWVGYGLSGKGGLYRNLPYVAAASSRASGSEGRARSSKETG